MDRKVDPHSKCIGNRFYLFGDHYMGLPNVARSLPGKAQLLQPAIGLLRVAKQLAFWGACQSSDRVYCPQADTTELQKLWIGHSEYDDQ